MREKGWDFQALTSLGLFELLLTTRLATRHRPPPTGQFALLRPTGYYSGKLNNGSFLQDFVAASINKIHEPFNLVSGATSTFWIVTTYK